MTTFYPPVLCRGHSFFGKNDSNRENAFHFCNFELKAIFTIFGGFVPFCNFLMRSGFNIVFFLISHNFVHNAHCFKMKIYEKNEWTK